MDPTTTSASSSPADQLKPSKAGKVSYTASQGNSLSLLVVHPSVTGARIFGLLLAALCLGLCLWLGRPLLKGGDPQHEQARIRTLYGSQIVEVTGLELRKGPVADLASMESLAELAKRYESMIMHLTEPTDAYLLWDNGMTYRYQPAGEVPRIGAGAPRRHRSAGQDA